MTARTTRRTTAARSRLAAVGAIAVAGALLLTGCGDQTETRAAAAPASRHVQHAPRCSPSCPQKIQDAGVIKVGSDIAYAPVEFKDGRQDRRHRPRPRRRAGQAARREVRVPERHLRQPDHGLQLQALRHRDVGHDRHQGPPGGPRRQGQEGRRGRRLRRLLHRRCRRSTPRRATPRASRPGRPVRQEGRRAARHDLRGPRQGPDQEVHDGGKKAIDIESFDNDHRGPDPGASRAARSPDLNDFPVAAYTAQDLGGGKDFEVVGEQVEAGPYGIAVGQGRTPSCGTR